MIKNIIFDYGGVLMDLDFMRTINELTELLDLDFKNKEIQNWFFELFKTFEIDGISEKDFIQQLANKASGKNVSTDAIINAWNSMMISIQKERFIMLKELKSKYGIYSVSYTHLTLPTICSV